MLKLIKNKLFINLFLLFAAVLSIILILNLETSYQQGINYEYKTVKIPLYLKIADFFSRHYHYRQLTRQIISSHNTEEENVIRLLQWTHENIRNAPEGFPVVDDHVWNIIIRGYGTDDQAHDVFTTLCNYAGITAFFTWVESTAKNERRVPFSFVKLKGKWYVFDPFRGVYFKDDKDKETFIDIETIKKEKILLEKLGEMQNMDYSNYIPNLPSLREIGLTRANTQSPLNRLLLEIRKWKDKIKGE